MEKATCVEDGCDRPRTGRSLICNHHMYLRRGGKDYGRKFRQRNRDRINAAARDRLHADPEFQAREAERQRRRTPEARARRRKDAELKRLYGIGIEVYEALIDAQGGCCGICGVTKPDTLRGWHVDHCHDTGQVRGILCGHCNTGIAMLREDTRVLLSAIQYLEGCRADQ